MLRLTKRQVGAASVEYIIVCFFIVFGTVGLLAPLPAEISPERHSAAKLLYEAIRKNYDRYVWANSIPL